MIWVPAIGQLVQLRGTGPRDHRDPKAEFLPKRKPAFAILNGFVMRSEVHILAEDEDDQVMVHLTSLDGMTTVATVNLTAIIPVQVGNSPVLGSN